MLKHVDTPMESPVIPPANLLALLLHGHEADQIFSPRRQIGEMVRFEIALVEALEASAIAPRGTGADCRRGVADFPSDSHLQAIQQAAPQSGNIAIPFVKLLTHHVRERVGDAADFIHFGATSQDLLDTALVLQLGDVCALVENSIVSICAELVRQTHRHRATLLAGRTWLQQGPPITFGLKTAQWLSAMLRHLERIQASRTHICFLQFGGAVGTLASLGSDGPSVADELAQRLALTVPDIPWHSQRDSLAEFASNLALLDGTLGKIARDLALMEQTEVAEVHTSAEGSGGSSTMPHKRNPVALAVILSASIRAQGLASMMFSAMVQEHERGLGGWHAEWETLPDLCRITCGALDAMASSLHNLQVDAAAMRKNIDSLHGVTMAESVATLLSSFVGRPAAHQVLEAASRRALTENLPLIEILRNDPAVNQHVSPEAIEKALNPALYLGASATFIDRVLARAQDLLPAEAT